MNQDRILTGVALMLAFCVLAPLLDMSSRLAANAGSPLGQIATAWFPVQDAVMLPIPIVMRLDWRMQRRTLALITLRPGFLILLSNIKWKKYPNYCRSPCQNHRVAWCRWVGAFKART